MYNINDEEILRCRTLWKYVIIQAIKDSSTLNKKRLFKNNSIKTKMYLNKNNKDFQLVCSLACVDINDIIKNKERFIERIRVKNKNYAKGIK